MSYKFNYKSLTISINYNTQLDNYNSIDMTPLNPIINSEP